MADSRGNRGTSRGRETLNGADESNYAGAQAESERGQVEEGKPMLSFGPEEDGNTPWKSGSVNKQLPEDRQRTVTLSRYAKVVGKVDDAEVAKGIAEQLKGLNIKVPFNVVTPSLRDELVKLGVKIGPLEKSNAEAEAEHTENGEGRMNAVRDFILNTFHSIMNGDAPGKKIPIGTLTADGKQFLEALSGLNMKEKVDFIINISDLRHIYKTHYGNNEKDKGKNIPLADADIWNIIDVICRPDEIVYGVDAIDGRKKFIFLKDSGNGTYNLAEVCSTKKGNLTAKSFYKTKKGSHLRAVELLNNSTLSTPKTSGASPSLTANIPQLFEISNNFNDKNNDGGPQKHSPSPPKRTLPTCRPLRAATWRLPTLRTNYVII